MAEKPDVQKYIAETKAVNARSRLYPFLEEIRQMRHAGLSHDSIVRWLSQAGLETKRSTLISFIKTQTKRGNFAAPVKKPVASSSPAPTTSPGSIASKGESIKPAGSPAKADQPAPVPVGPGGRIERSTSPKFVYKRGQISEEDIWGTPGQPT